MADYGEFIGYQDGMLLLKVGRGFTDTEVFPIPVRVCVRCGAVVVDEDRHDIWHGTLETRP